MNSDSTRPCRCGALSAVILIIGLSASASNVHADGAISSVKTIRLIPRTNSELQLAHERSRAMSCELIPTSEPVEMSSFTPYLSPTDRQRGGKNPEPATRRPIMTIGLDVLKDDQGKLPTLTRSAILKYLDEHYVNVQARLQKHTESGKLYLHHRPMAGTVLYTGAKITQEFNDTVAEAVNDFHSLGLFIKPRAQMIPENLRTLVLVHRNRLASTTAGAKADSVTPVYELVFIRAVPDNKDSDRLTLHTFTTTDQRKTLNYLQPPSQPSRVDECTIKGSIFFTTYQKAQLVPKESATRRFQIKSRSKISVATLDQFAKSQGWSGDAFDNLTDVLDAVIEGRVKNPAMAGTK